MSDSSLTLTESAALADCERIINRGKNIMREAGRALMRIRDERLYREEHDTFEGYCQSRWGMSRQNASYLITGSAAVDALPPDLSTMVDSPRSARALAAVPEEEREPVLREVKKSGKKVTARAISEAAKARSAPEPEPEPEVDEHAEFREIESLDRETMGNFGVHFLAFCLSQSAGNPNGPCGTALKLALKSYSEP